ncbi:hypothetical protein RRF57_000590 [Xylaria bambusicola]|uniref:Uncharacterized protein n=1 Tax=Xylaria bambusicola TaxID=326684 RepID=A0AAN7UNW6_9PEZI
MPSFSYGNDGARTIVGLATGVAQANFAVTSNSVDQRADAGIVIRGASRVLSNRLVDTRWPTCRDKLADAEGGGHGGEGRECKDSDRCHLDSMKKRSSIQDGEWLGREYERECGFLTCKIANRTQPVGGFIKYHKFATMRGGPFIGLMKGDGIGRATNERGVDQNIVWGQGTLFEQVMGMMLRILYFPGQPACKDGSSGDRQQAYDDQDPVPADASSPTMGAAKGESVYSVH